MPSNFDIVMDGLLSSQAAGISGSIDERRRWQSVLNSVSPEYQSMAKSLLKSTELSAEEILNACNVGKGKVSNTTSSGDKYQDGARAAAELLGKVYIPPQFEREYETQLVLDPAEYAAGAEVAKQLAPFTQHPR